MFGKKKQKTLKKIHLDWLGNPDGSSMILELTIEGETDHYIFTRDEIGGLMMWFATWYDDTGKDLPFIADPEFNSIIQAFKNS